MPLTPLYSLIVESHQIFSNMEYMIILIMILLLWLALFDFPNTQITCAWETDLKWIRWTIQTVLSLYSEQNQFSKKILPNKTEKVGRFYNGIVMYICVNFTGFKSRLLAALFSRVPIVTKKVLEPFAKEDQENTSTDY